MHTERFTGPLSYPTYSVDLHLLLTVLVMLGGSAYELLLCVSFISAHALTTNPFTFTCRL
jgi:hypothetical protein